ncbi:MAG TPA: hypothetical protein VKA53_08440 [Thermoanaerobaculia bacterium]|nr:hypothetical protein [Thermoanaerobaculia bacterium]
MKRGPAAVAVALLSTLAFSFAAYPSATSERSASEARRIGTYEGKPVVVGHLSRREIEKLVPDWVGAEVTYRPFPSTARKLTTVKPGAEVTVYLGTWCSDSRREVSRLWRALDEVGDDVPFTIRYFGIDHGIHRPSALVKRAHIVRVPTIVVERGGHEVGRIVEVSPHGIENDLLALLSGKEHGLVTGSEDLLGHH